MVLRTNNAQLQTDLDQTILNMNRTMRHSLHQYNQEIRQIRGHLRAVQTKKKFLDRKDLQDIARLTEQIVQETDAQAHYNRVMYQHARALMSEDKRKANKPEFLGCKGHCGHKHKHTYVIKTSNEQHDTTQRRQMELKDREI